MSPPTISNTSVSALIARIGSLLKSCGARTIASITFGDCRFRTAMEARFRLVEWHAADGDLGTIGRKILKPASLFCFPLLLAACQPLPSVEPAPSATAVEGGAFAEASCAECHAVGRYGISRISNAPPFPVIVNQEGVTAETLSYWLEGAHNYPREMDFYLREREVDGLVAYMLTLQDPNFRRPPD